MLRVDIEKNFGGGGGGFLRMDLPGRDRGRADVDGSDEPDAIDDDEADIAVDIVAGLVAACATLFQFRETSDVGVAEYRTSSLPS